MKTLFTSLSICFIFLASAQTFEQYNTADGFMVDPVRSISFDQNGGLWLINQGFGGGGVVHLNGSSVVTYPIVSNLNICPLTSIDVDGNNIPWVAGNRQLLKFDGSSWDTLDLGNYDYESSFDKMDFDDQNNLWLSNYYFNGSLMKYASDSLALIYEQSDSSFLQRVENVYVRGTDVWFSISGFLGKFDGTNFAFYNASQFYAISDITSDSQGNIWVADYYGVGKFDGTNWTNYMSDGITMPYPVNAIAVDHNDQVYIGGDNSLWKFNGTGWTRFTSFPGQNMNSVYTIKVDANNNKWIGAVQGLFRLVENAGLEEEKTENFKLYPNPFTDQFEIELGEGQYWSLLDLQGNRLCDEASKATLAGLASGMYLLEVWNAGGRISTQKIQKM